MKNILIVSGHTDLNDSVANKKILELLADSLPQSRQVHLDKLYPDFAIDVRAEQEKLLWADIIVLQFPVFWFSMPSLMHRWMECIFLHGFSHGSSGDKLRGKKLVLSYTTGAPSEAVPFDDFFLFLKAAAQFTGMEYAGSVATGNVSYQMRQDPELLAQIDTKAAEHAQRLVQFLTSMD